MAPDGSTSYQLLVSGGYVRLLRHGSRESGRITGLRFARLDGDWVPIDSAIDPERLATWELEASGLPAVPTTTPGGSMSPSPTRTSSPRSTTPVTPDGATGASRPGAV